MKSVLSAEQDNGMRFDELCNLLRRMGFEEHIRGSHHLYQRAGFAPINLQPVQGMAKSYQVRQVRKALKDGGVS